MHGRNYIMPCSFTHSQHKNKKNKKGMKPSNNNQITQDRASDFGVYGGEDENGFTHGMTVNWDREEDVL